MKLILRDVLLILMVCMNTVEHFRLNSPQNGNHEIILIRPGNKPLESPNILDLNSDLNNRHSPLRQFSL